MQILIQNGRLQQKRIYVWLAKNNLKRAEFGFLKSQNIVQIIFEIQ